MKRHFTFKVLIFLSLLIFLSPLTTYAQCTGDFNSDGKIDFSDLLIFAVAYNTTSSDAKYNPLCDLNSDNAINFSDLLIFAVNYGETCVKGSITGKIMVPEQSKTRDISGWVPLPNATVTLTDSTGHTHTVNTDENGNYSFSQVPPGNNYIITATGEVEGNTVVLKDVVPQLAEGEDYDAGTADAQSTAIALVVESILESDPDLTPEDINLDDISTAESLPALEDAVQNTLDNYGDVTSDPEVEEAVTEMEVNLWLNEHAAAWLDYNVEGISSLIQYDFVIKNYNWDSVGNYSKDEYEIYLTNVFEFLTIDTFSYKNNEIFLENGSNETVVYSDKYIACNEGEKYFDEINKIYFHLIKTENGWKADEYRV